MRNLRSGFFFFFFLFSCGVFSQAGNLFNPVVDDVADKIPPLSVLIDSALANDPYIAFRDNQISANTDKLNSNRILWTRNFGLSTELRYGNFSYYSTNESSVQTAPIPIDRAETRYGIGAYINFPIYDYLNRKHIVSLAKTEIEQARNMAEMQRKELTERVIRQYNTLIVSQRLLKVKTKSFETSQLSIEMAEKEFSNGVLPVVEYARVSEIHASLESEYESAKMDFKTAFMVLETLVGMKLSISPNIK